MYDYSIGTRSAAVSSAADAGIWAIISFLVALCGAIVLYFTFLNPKNAHNYTGFTKKLYDFLSFKIMSLEMILKICYLFVAIWITLSSFSLISTSFVAFLCMIFFGNVIARLVFESALLILMIHRRLVEINSKLPEKNAEKVVDEK